MQGLVGMQPQTVGFAAKLKNWLKSLFGITGNVSAINVAGNLTVSGGTSITAAAINLGGSTAANIVGLGSSGYYYNLQFNAGQNRGYYVGQNDGFGGFFASAGQTQGYFFGTLTQSSASCNAGIGYVTTGVVQTLGSNASTTTGWIQNSGGVNHVGTAVHNATATLAAVTGISVTLIAGRTYTGRATIKCNNTVAAEGITFDWYQGSATMTSFWCAMGLLTGSGTDTPGTTISTSLSGTMNYTTITGETVFEFQFSFVCNQAGTFALRMASNNPVTGTATVEVGSFIQVEDSQ
jgi:hypothetical protein